MNRQERLLKAVEDMENAHKYLLPKEQVKEVEGALSELEEKLFEGNIENLIKTEIEESGSVRKIFNIIHNQEPVYQNILLAWSFGKHKELVEKAKLGLEIRSFYEGKNQMLPYLAELGGMVAIFGRPEETNLKVFAKEKDEFCVYTLELPDVKILRDDKAGTIDVLGKQKPELNVVSRGKWTGDYRKIVERFLQEEAGGKKYTIMLLDVPFWASSDDMKLNMILSSYLPMYQSYHKSKSEKNSKEGKGK